MLWTEQALVWDVVCCSFVVAGIPTPFSISTWIKVVCCSFVVAGLGLGGGVLL